MVLTESRVAAEATSMHDKLVEYAALQNELVRIVYTLGETDAPVLVPEAACREALGVAADVFAHVVIRLQTREVLNSSCPAGWLRLTGRGVQLARKLKLRCGDNA